MLSMVIPSFNAVGNLRAMLMEAVQTYKDQVDELIVIEDGGNYDDEIRQHCHSYVWNRENRGFTFAVNQGIKIATSDYIAIASSDTRLEKGNLHDLCIPNTVVSPLITTQKSFEFAGSFFVVPRSVIDLIGLLDERLKIYWSDTEFVDRLNNNKIPIVKNEDVHVFHHVAQTVANTDHIGGNDEVTYKHISTNLQT